MNIFLIYFFKQQNIDRRTQLSGVHQDYTHVVGPCIR